MVTDALSYDELSEALMRLEYLQFTLDFSAHLLIAYEGQTSDTVISLLTEPEKAFESIVTTYLQNDRNNERLRYRWLQCPRCNASYPLGSVDGVTCPTLQGSERCDARLATVVEVIPENLLRERAGRALCRTPEGIRRTVCGWIAQEIRKGSSPPEDCCLNLADCQTYLTQMMETDVDRLNSSIPELGDLLHLEGRRRLFPQGRTLEEQYDDYRSVRDKLITCHNRLLGFARKHPVAGERREQLRRFSHFPLPVPMRKSTQAVAPAIQMAGQNGKSTKGKRIQERMLAKIQEDGQAVYWSSNQWAESLQCSAGTVKGTQAWKKVCSPARERTRLAQGHRLRRDRRQGQPKHY
jgi:hypothetical protein